ncbi:fungal-specific transcription factor domain-containing protein [Dichomitus squalens]|uniref:Fungal-specific transcription factor domain-containing protein n=1 Tax=Dichomitus squalens TaxID=114155 RepID=A0A4Q9PPR6_9APHY|nr:fungal-specific transcription factor domain-containing protein [Dichomitus squalens]TBU56352.1 fungal-specific transcription factor domain-containing protein [Dichomitus squalens]
MDVPHHVSRPYESPPQPYPLMADSLHYPATPTHHYVPNAYYASQMHAGAAHMHVVAPSTVRQDPASQRKRPKYTRSKTGCLTCRAKKIKCDETKPTCVRCSHGQRECTWPEGVPTRKKPTPRREPPSPIDGMETRPSTAGSSGVSEAATPPTRGPTPPRRGEPVEMGIPPMVSRRHSDPHVNLPIAVNDNRRSAMNSVPTSSHGYPMHHNNTHALPAIPEIAASYTNQHQYLHSYPSHHYSQSHSSHLPRITAHHDVPHSRGTESSSPDSQWSSPQLLTPVDPIEPYFPTPQERNLIRHYCDNALSIIMAYPSENPVLAANFQFLFDGVRGTDSAVESLRLALLGVAAVHQSFLLSRSGVSSLAADEALHVADTFRAKSLHQLTSACATPEGAHNDAALAATVAIALIDIFSGGRHWAKSLDFAKSLVKSRGGPGLLLARSRGHKANSVTGVSRARLLLEIVAVYELFGCLAQGKAPSLLNIDCWWLTKTNAHDNVSYIDKVFGMSREFILVLAEVATLVARVLCPSTSTITELSESRDHDAQTREAEKLYRSLENWRTVASNVHERVLAGNCVYRHAAQILLLRDVLKAPPSDALVQEHANTILTLCMDCCQSRMGVDLTWPVIIAGTQLYGTDRSRVLAIFELFRTQCCYEIETSELIVRQVWERLDTNHPNADWRSVMQDNKIDVLIL